MDSLHFVLSPCHSSCPTLENPNYTSYIAAQSFPFHSFSSFMGPPVQHKKKTILNNVWTLLKFHYHTYNSHHRQSNHPTNMRLFSRQSILFRVHKISASHDLHETDLTMNHLQDYHHHHLANHTHPNLTIHQHDNDPYPAHHSFDISRRHLLKALLYSSLSVFVADAVLNLRTPPQAHAWRLSNTLKSKDLTDSFDRASFVYAIQGASMGSGIAVGKNLGINTMISNVRSSSHLMQTDVPKVLDILTGADVCYFGLHRKSLTDHLLVSRIVKEIKLRRVKALTAAELPQKQNVVVALEHVPIPFQATMNLYCQGKITDDALYTRLNWVKNSPGWSFDQLLPLLWTCKRNSIPILAIGDDQTLLKKVQDSGLEVMSPDERRRCIIDPLGFALTTIDDQYRYYYANIMEREGFREDPAAASSATRPPVKRPYSSKAATHYYASKALNDESVVTRLAQYLKLNPDTLILTVVEQERVKFGFGLAKRMERVTSKMAISSFKDYSLLLNTTTADTGLDPNSASLLSFLKLEDMQKDTTPERLGIDRLLEGLNVSLDLATLSTRQTNPETHIPLCDFIWYNNQSPEVQKISKQRSSIYENTMYDRGDALFPYY